MKKLIAAGLIVLGTLGWIFPQKELAAEIPALQQSGARINIEEAKTIASEQVEGKIINMALENEGNSLVYDIDIQKSGTVYEVTINAATGKVVGIKKELKGSMH